jgi:hypothetical protein
VGVQLLTKVKISKRIRDVLLEVVSVTVLLSGAIAYVVMHPKATLNWGAAAFAVNTIVVFGFLISWFRQEWKRLVFWTVLIVVLLLQWLIYVSAFQRLSSNIPLIYYTFFDTVELALIVPILSAILVHKANRE